MKALGTGFIPHKGTSVTADSQVHQQTHVDLNTYMDRPSMSNNQRESKRYSTRLLRGVSVIVKRENPELLSYRRAEPSSKGAQRQFPSTTLELRPPPFRPGGHARSIVAISYLLRAPQLVSD